MEPVCDVAPFIFYDCLNLLVELRGASTAYTDIYDYPEIVGRFVDWSVDVNMRVFDAQAALLTKFTDCSMGDDVGFPPAWTVVGELKKRMHPVPIGVGIPRDAFLKGLKEKNLPGGVMYGLSAESLSEANKIMEQVFEYKSLE